MSEKMNVNKFWIPFWVDKWLFGSTRHELEPDERSVWLDLLALASKNEGYIRANENTPYPDSQLAGLLVISVELLQRTLNKCIRYEKMVKLENGTYYIANWEKYQLSKRHKRRFKVKKRKVKNSKVKNRREENRESDKSDIVSGKADKCDMAQSITGWMSYYNQALKNKGWIKRELMLTHARKRLIESRLKEYSLADLRKCVDNFVCDEWPDRYKYIDPKYCIGIIGGRDLLERWLNADSKPQETKDSWDIGKQRTREMLDKDRKERGGK